MRALIFLVWLIFTAVTTQAATDTAAFSSEALRERYMHFIQELRCPKCQNQNLADSQAPIAADLRQQLQRLLEERKSDEEIADYMVQRYGDYILYRPRLEQKTWLLWSAPALMFAGGLVVLTGIVWNARRSRPSAVTGDALADEERRRLDELLDRNKEAP